MNSFFVLIGSNNEATRNIASAMNILSSSFPDGMRFSDILESAAVDREGIVQIHKNLYLNTIGHGETNLDKEAVISIFKEIEHASGRNRDILPARQISLDLDLVEWNGEVLRIWDAEQSFYKACRQNLSEKFAGI
jgi:7,8-dihydro-6-hydroxymethylpterin-pyrophosphokinase